jgi:NADH-quinone oxidoreductase subunit G
MPPKPVASCAMPASDGMKIHTDTPMVKKAREGVMEFLLANHPLDCPICDQGGECDLQDQAYQYGSGKSHYHEHKRAVTDKNMGPLIKTQMTRCIHCTRCARFIEDVAGTCEIGAVNRGENMEITTYLEQGIKSELSGNIIDLCPVGALTSKPYAFKARSWELRKTETIDVMDAVGSNIRIDSRGVEIMRILPRLNEEINEEWISDKTRFCYDGLKYQRLDKPYIKREGKLQSASFADAYKAIVETIKSVEANEVAVLSGQLSSVEENFALKKICEKLGIKNFDCRLSGEKLSAADSTSYLFNTKISGIDEADVCLLIGVNPRKDAPILNARIRKRFLSKKLKVMAVGVNADLTYAYENLGDDISALKNIDLSAYKKPMLILGHDLVARADGDQIINLAKKIAEKSAMIRDDWNGFNFLSKTTGLINGLVAGFVGDSNINEITQKCASGAIKILILHAVDDQIDFDKFKNTFVIYVGTHGDRGAHIADVILPASTYAEKEAIYFNLEGRAQATVSAIMSPGEAKPDWQIFAELAKNFGFDLGEKPEFESVTNQGWINSKNLSENFVDEKISVKNFDFYLTNPIARASRILNKCSSELS